MEDELNIKEFTEIPGVLDSIENRCLAMRHIIPDIEHQPELKRCVFTLLEDNLRTSQVLVDAFCVLDED